MNILVSLIGSLVAILVSIISSYLANKNNNKFQLRKLKEEHYVKFIEALHKNAAWGNVDRKYVSEYTFYRDKLFIIASEDVICALIDFEERTKIHGPVYDEYLTKLIKAIREDLSIKDKNLPTIFFKC